MFEAFLAQAGDDAVLVRQPAARTTPASDVEKVMGRRPAASQDDGVGETTNLLAVVSDAAVVLADRFQAVPPRIATLGKVESIDLLLRCRLEDVLVDSGSKYGKTILDTAKDVVVGGVSFTIRAIDRTGLPPEGPYICWAALRRVD